MSAFVIAAMMFLFLAFPSQSSQAAVHALKVWGLDVVPSLFPYMVLCQSFISQAQNMPIRMPVLISILGLLGGSPSASAALVQSASVYRYSDRQILSLCALTGTISPMFFLGPLSVWIQSRSAGRLLLGVHITAAFLSAALVCLLFPCSLKRKTIESSIQNQQMNPIVRSVNSILNVGGCIVFFSVAACSLKIAFPFIHADALAFIHAMLEVSGGLKALSVSKFTYELRMILFSAALGFGSFSILVQNLLFLRPLGISMPHLVLIGMLRALLGGMIMALLMLF